MLDTLTPDIQQQLTRIGFDDEEITIIRYIHQFKGKDLMEHIRESVTTYCFQRMMEEATRTWDQRHLTEEQAFDIVEEYRTAKRQ